jgi:hypothetical protein
LQKTNIDATIRKQQKTKYNAMIKTTNKTGLTQREVGQYLTRKHQNNGVGRKTKGNVPVVLIRKILLALVTNSKRVREYSEVGQYFWIEEKLDSIRKSRLSFHKPIPYHFLPIIQHIIDGIDEDIEQSQLNKWVRDNVRYIMGDVIDCEVIDTQPLNQLYLSASDISKNTA